MGSKQLPRGPWTRDALTEGSGLGVSPRPSPRVSALSEGRDDVVVLDFTFRNCQTPPTPSVARLRLCPARGGLPCALAPCPGAPGVCGPGMTAVPPPPGCPRSSFLCRDPRPPGTAPCVCFQAAGHVACTGHSSTAGFHALQFVLSF